MVDRNENRKREEIEKDQREAYRRQFEAAGSEMRATAARVPERRAGRERRMSARGFRSVTP